MTNASHARYWAAGSDWLDIVPRMSLERTTQIGFATNVFWRSGLPPHQSWVIPQYIQPAISLRQAAFQFDNAGQPDAVVAWAFLSTQVTADLVANPWRSFHISEWNEGSDLWIMALVAAPRRAVPLLMWLLEERLAGCRRVRGFRRKRDGSIARLLDCTRPDEKERSWRRNACGGPT